METLTSWLRSPASSTRFSESRELKFFIHDEEHSVKPTDVPPHTTLNTYLRKHANLTGTKNMCHEGGCGACIVAVTVMDPVTNREQVFAVNSCLIPLYSCSGWKIHTIEKIGDAQKGYHPVQKAIVQFNGTQCGYCSPGMVMNMYALYESGKFTMKHVENSFGGNICRCTGYRSILSAFKSLATDASTEILGTYADIEDIPMCKQTQTKCQAKCAHPCGKQLQAHYYNFGESKWMKVFSINETLDAMKEVKDGTYMIVGGNTANGVYKRAKEPDVYIDITSVKNLLEYSLSDNAVTLGANMSLTNTINLFQEVGKNRPQFSYLEKIADHIDLIANVPVRNMGTLAGNLFIKHEHHEFPSDIFVIFETIGATLTIVDTDRQETTKNLNDFLSLDMRGKLIKNIILPALDSSYKFETYKIMPRAQNAHALVNAGFLLKLDTDNKVESARIVYGSINPSFTHATKAESFLVGKNLFDNETLKGLFNTLDSEITPDHVLPDPTPEFRKQLAISLCYKFILSITPDDKISSRNKSGGGKQTRPISTSAQEYDTNKSMYPVTEPIPKIEALAQCSGQAEYIMDKPDYPNQLYAAFVLAKASPNSVISKIDPSKALALDGVEAFYDKGDIPGPNDFVPVEGVVPFFKTPEEIFCTGIIKHYFQPVGMIVANSQELAENAANLVDVQCATSTKKPLITTRDVLKADDKDKITMEGKQDAKRKGSDTKHVIKGKFDISWQYHYYMETQCCVAIPVEDGLDMHPSTQSLNLAQVAAAKALNIPMNKVNVSVRRIGGGYGGKITRNSLVSTAAAIAAYKLQKPVKMSLPLITNMNIIGKRNPLSMDYEVGVDDNGKIQYLNTSLYSDIGYSGTNENPALPVMGVFGNAYDKDTWNIKMYSTKTDNPSGCSTRAPGTTEAIGAVESIMEHISSSLNLDPLKVRQENWNRNNPDPIKYVDDLVKWADVKKRKKEIMDFNKANRWVKKGMAIVPMEYPLFFFGYWHALVCIYHGDGSVSVAHGGIEMGQGINTKVAQVCAWALGVPLEQVKIKPTTDLSSPNALPSGGSVTSENVCWATLQACNKLKERMKPVKEKMKNPTWKELVRQCYLESVDLSARSLFNTKTATDMQMYSVFGATCTEVEVDILTGLHQITRVDLLEDTGNSLSPQVDIGQVEGAFVMGLGYWTCEQIVINEDGEILTNRTWNYKPPGAKDIPIDFRVRFPKNNPNVKGFLHSKGTAEPPLCMSCSIAFAIRDAVASARTETDPKADKWYPVDGPSTVENTFVNSLPDYKQYTL